MPIALLKAYVAMLPRLSAEEQLARINADTMVLGGRDDADRARLLRDLERAARGPDNRPARKAEPADLAGMGIGLKSADGAMPVIGDVKGWLDHG